MTTRRSGTARTIFATLIAALLCLAAMPAWAQPAFPALSGRVVDQARLLSDAKEAEITAKLAALEADTGDQLVVVTVNSLEDLEIEDYGYRLGRAWGIGASETDSGVLLVVAPNERKVRIEVGYGLEPILTDALSNTIIQNDILPPFREGGYERGITAGVDAIDTQLRLDPAEAQARAAAAEPTASELPLMPGIIIAVIFILLFSSLIRAAGGGRRGRRRGATGGIDPILIWTAAEILGSGRSRSGGSGGGFGGFSGGGGSFGGGGASGGW